MSKLMICKLSQNPSIVNAITKAQISGIRNLHVSINNAQDEKNPKDKELGWFSRMLGIQHIETFKVAHSSMLADKESVYELVKHRVHPANNDKYLSSYDKLVNSMASKKVPVELKGSWNVKFGEQDQMVHLWKYNTGYVDVDNVMEVFEKDKQLSSMIDENAQMCTSRINYLLLAFNFWGELKARPPKHIYELRTYVLKAGTMMEWGNNWIKGIQNRRGYNQDVGGFFTQIGKLHKVYHIWAYDSFAERQRIRQETWLKPGWDTNVAYTVPLIRKMKSQILLPNPFSPMQ